MKKIVTNNPRRQNVRKLRKAVKRQLFKPYGLQGKGPVPIP